MTALAFKLDSPDIFGDDFARHRGELPGAGLAWLEARRRAAMDAFLKTGIPNRRVEAWKYTDLANALASELAPAVRAARQDSEGGIFASVPGARLHLVNGFLEHVTEAAGLEAVDLVELDSDTPEWVSANLGMTAAGRNQPMGAVSLALMRGGVAVRVHEDQTLHLSFANPADDGETVSHARILIVVEDGVSFRLLESHGASSGAFANIGMELVLKRGAKLEHVRVQEGGPNALHVTTLGAQIARDAEYRALYVAMGGRLARLDAEVTLGAPGARATLHNVAALNAGIADTTTVMDHAASNTTSRQLFKSVVGGRGRAVNQGRVAVRAGAVKSDSHQLFKAILLSPTAEADAKPELEIFADDVICGHGTAIGALDEDALFYLRARGIPEHEAKGVLIRAFLEDAIEGFGGDVVHDVIAHRLDAALVTLGEAVP